MGGTGAGGPAFGVLHIDIDSRIATLDGQSLDLTRAEFDLLARLAKAPGVVVPGNELLSHVWGQEWVGDDTSLETHISRLRRKLGESASDPRYIKTVRGVGYKLEPPTATPPATARPSRRWLIASGVAAVLLAAGGLALFMVSREAPQACAPGYEPCLPVADDLDCSQIKQQVRITGDDPYGLDKDGDGLGCQLYAP